MNQQTYLKVPFVWEEPKPLIEVPSQLRFESLKAVSNTVLISVLTKEQFTTLEFCRSIVVLVSETVYCQRGHVYCKR